MVPAINCNLPPCAAKYYKSRGISVIARFEDTLIKSPFIALYCSRFPLFFFFPTLLHPPIADDNDDNDDFQDRVLFIDARVLLQFPQKSLISLGDFIARELLI